MNEREGRQGAAEAVAPKRTLWPLDLAAIGLNATVGSGIFLLPDDLYRAMGWLSPLAFLLCALGLYPIALCYAEASSTTTDSGGPYLYAAQAFGPRVGFAVGWMCFSNAVFSFAAVAAAAASYGHKLVPRADSVVLPVLGLVVIALFGALNYWGARPGAWAIRLFTVGKFAVLLLLVSVLLPQWSTQRIAASTALSLGGVGQATFMALFALQGFEVVPVPAGETHAPKAAVPRAVLATLLTCALFYIVIQAVLVLGFDGISLPSDAPLADAAIEQSPGLGILVTLGALVSTLGFVSGSALGTPRYLFALAARDQLPKILGKVHPVFFTPHVAIVTTCCCAAFLVVFFDYRTLIGMSNVAVAVQYAATCGAVLQTRLAGEPRRGMGWPVTGLLCSVWICWAASREEVMLAAASLGLGAIIYAATSARGRLWRSKT